MFSFASGYIRNPVLHITPRIQPSEFGLLCQYQFNNDNNNPYVLQQKLDGLFNMTRIGKNGLPISILVGLSGYIGNSDKGMLLTPQFWGAFSIVQLISAASMVINDLFDIEVDRINNPERPLVQGSVTVSEAILFTVSMLSLVPIIGYYVLSTRVEHYWWGAIGLILLYTPILKRVFFIKNLVCATVVSSTVPFVAFSVMTNPLTNLHWITLTSKTLFMASLYIEVLLDITDVEGDRENGIQTLPVILGKGASIIILAGFISIGWVNMLIDLFKNDVSIYVFTGIILSYVPFYTNLCRIWRTQCSPQCYKIIIKNSIKQTTLSLIIYFASIALLQ